MNLEKIKDYDYHFISFDHISFLDPLQITDEISLKN